MPLPCLHFRTASVRRGRQAMPYFALRSMVSAASSAHVMARQWLLPLSRIGLSVPYGPSENPYFTRWEKYRDLFFKFWLDTAHLLCYTEAILYKGAFL